MNRIQKRPPQSFLFFFSANFQSLILLFLPETKAREMPWTTERAKSCLFVQKQQQLQQQQSRWNIRGTRHEAEKPKIYHDSRFKHYHHDSFPEENSWSCLSEYHVLEPSTLSPASRDLVFTSIPPWERKGLVFFKPWIQMQVFGKTEDGEEEKRKSRRWKWNRWGKNLRFLWCKLRIMLWSQE